MAKPVLAEYKKPTNQSNDAPSSQSTGIAATRGTCNSADNKTKANSATLTTLAPYGHVGQSTATNPTFVWYVPDRESYPVEFWLYESDPASYSGKGEQVYQTRLSSSSGIMTHSLPTEVSLVPGRTYVWQVAIICNPNSPSQSLVVNNRVKIVEVDPATTSQLNNAENPVTKADVYAQSGLWYDALAEVALLEDPQAENATIKLISQLAEIEEDSSNFKQIIESLQHK
ncbi:DUF928 domain-containing protein [Pleurocapsales cyanobacterium LEGE 10410]|nr:DUF928 domain-containing protein [Pleurocapsales cyanobacterium LEGE 10410]